MSLSTTKNPGKSGMKARVWTLDTVRDRCKIVGDCWIWQQGCNGSGHPIATIEGQYGKLIRRFVLDVTGRSRTANHGWVARCSCGEKRCVSPEHLSIESRSAMSKRIFADGVRIPALERVTRSRAAVAAQGVLTEAQVIEIRSSVGVSDKDFAVRFGCSPNTVRNVRVGNSWACVPMLANRSVFGVAA